MGTNIISTRWFRTKTKANSRKVSNNTHQYDFPKLLTQNTLLLILHA